jgi:hypothetical protein
MSRWSVLVVVCLVAVFACNAAQAARILRLNEDNWHLVPGGAEVDAIYGDWLLQNDQLTAVVAATTAKPLRMGNTMLPDARGVLIDLASRSRNADQLMAIVPARQGQEMAYTQARLIRGHGPSVCLRVTRLGPLSLETDYILEDGKPYLTLITRATNNGKAPAPCRCGDLLRAEGTFEQGVMPGDQAAWAEDRWNQVAYGIVPCKGLVYTATVNQGRDKGVHVTYPAAGGEEGIVRLNHGESVTWERRVLVSDSSLGISALAWDCVGTSLCSAEVAASGPRGEPIAGARVQFSAAGKPVAAAMTDAAGKVWARLPAGTYTVRVSARGRGDCTLEVTLPSDAPLVAPLKAASGVAVEVRDEKGQALPCKVQFLTTTPGVPDPELGPWCGSNEVRNIYYTQTGSFTETLEPETYRVVISRGPEYDAVFRTVIVEPGKITPVAATLKRSVDTRGWIASDLHGHTTISGDNTSSVAGRILNLACEGLEFAPSTDHVAAVPWGPTIARLGLTPWLSTCCGEEISGPGAATHQNAFPLPVRPHTQANGGIPAGGDLDAQVTRIYEWNNRSDKLIQFNHPDVGRGFFDRNGDGKLDGGFKKAVPLFDAMEAMGNPLSGTPARPTRCWSWLTVLNQGLHITGTANTDTHTCFHGNGRQRNYIRCSTDDPAQIDPMEIVHQVRAGRVVMSTGPFMEVTADGLEPGASLSAKNACVRLHVKVQCPNWMDINRVQVLINGRPAPDLNFTRKSHARYFHDGVVKFDRQIPLRLERDAHVVVVAVGEGLSLSPVIGGRGGGGEPLAVSNPIWMDVDGGGFTPTYDTMGAYGKPTAAADAEG